jgi:hypothetical protein
MTGRKEMAGPLVTHIASLRLITCAKAIRANDGFRVFHLKYPNMTPCIPQTVVAELCLMCECRSGARNYTGLDGGPGLIKDWRRFDVTYGNAWDVLKVEQQHVDVRRLGTDN